MTLTHSVDGDVTPTTDSAPDADSVLYEVVGPLSAGSLIVEVVNASGVVGSYSAVVAVAMLEVEGNDDIFDGAESRSRSRSRSRVRLHLARG